MAAIRWTLHIFCCRATSWDSGVCLICYTMLYIYNTLPVLQRPAFSLHPGCVSVICCLGFGVVQGLVICYVSAVMWLFSGGGPYIPVVGGGGGVIFMIFRVSSGGLLVWGHFGYFVCVVLVLPGELCLGAP